MSPPPPSNSPSTKARSQAKSWECYKTLNFLAHAKNSRSIFRGVMAEADDQQLIPMVKIK